MTNKNLWLGMTVVGCNNGSAGDNRVDIWANVTSLSQLNGIWKGLGTETLTTEEGITMKTITESTITIDANTKTMSGSAKVTMTFSGSNIRLVWSSLKAAAISEYSCAAFDDANYSIIMTELIPLTPIHLSNMGGTQINQNGTKLKLPPERDGSPEVFIYKLVRYVFKMTLVAFQKL